MSDFVFDNRCFVCSPAAEDGLGAEISAAGGKAELLWRAAPKYQGYRGVLHGGVVATLLDEAMAYAAISLRGTAVTAEMRVRYRRPVAVGVPLRVRAAVQEAQGRQLLTTAELYQGEEVHAEGEGRYVTRGDGAGGPVMTTSTGRPAATPGAAAAGSEPHLRNQTRACVHERSRPPHPHLRDGRLRPL